MKKRRALGLVETIGAIAWFAMDGAWLLGAATCALVLAAPTLGLNLLVFRYAATTWPTRLVTAAMTSWAAMNILWMASDLGLVSWGTVVARVFLGLGVVLLGVALLVRRSEAFHALGERFRRLRVRV